MSGPVLPPSLLSVLRAPTALPVAATCHGLGASRPSTYTRQRWGRAQTSGTPPISTNTTPQTIQPPLTLPPRTP